MDKLYQDKIVTLDVLVGLLETSESTVRRDLDELEAENRLHRIHGGAELPHSLQEELTIQEKSIKNIQEKSLLARYAAQLVLDDSVIFIDAGTTTALMIDHLRGQNLTVVTNSINHASRLVDRGFKTIIIGGMVKQSTNASIGPLSKEQIDGLSFDIAFVGTNGIDECFLTTPDMEEAAIKRAILANARKSFVIMDDSKLGHVCFAKFAKVEEVSLITNASASNLLMILKEKTEVIDL